ncbi:Rne/Rng family ribonuclease [Mycetocola sp. JXN-3]|uniref:Rne/Rng family ribonuclease n=1 Tax=Mycetocola sp. JXN-3 TaxID=2116510 RepID=UPI00165D12C5|nr:Rne/Rng family ribonuclease [Mycetocola sp. JXN-3]
MVNKNKNEAVPADNNDAATAGVSETDAPATEETPARAPRRTRGSRRVSASAGAATAPSEAAVSTEATAGAESVVAETASVDASSANGTAAAANAVETPATEQAAAESASTVSASEDSAAAGQPSEQAPAVDAAEPVAPRQRRRGRPTKAEQLAKAEAAEAAARQAAEGATVEDASTPATETEATETEAAEASAETVNSAAADSTSTTAAAATALDVEAEAASATEAPATEAPATAAPKIVSPLPVPFVSAPSTALIFLAPDLPPLPARPARAEFEPEEDEEYSSTRRRSRRRGGDRDNARDERPSARDNVRDNPRDGGRDGYRENTRDNYRDGDRRENTRPAREPREAVLITEPQKIKGSTRLEAKKQRRRDGRDAGRRRAVVTEAEFLARREAVDRTMVVREKNQKIQIGVLEDKVLVEHYVARNEEASLIGNVYLGRVQNVLPSMEAAFVDIGRGRNAVLYSGEVDWEAAGTTGNQPRRIELALKPGDKILVQVTKDPVGHKGARLTSQVSLPGRYLVYVPNGSMSGISRKLPDTERARLKKILKAVLPENTGVIVRTAAEGATEEQLTLDVNRLTSQWAHISEQVKKANAPALLHSEPDLLVKIVRDVFNEDFQSMVIAGDDAREIITSYLQQVAPDLVDRVERYEGSKDVFDEYRITEQIEKALDRKVWLPSGGSLVIDRTEAMTVIDVNTGKFVGSGGNLEETVTKNNLEAAEEIVRQLRLRDIGGIIVVDFIDMVLESNRDLVLRRVIECLSRDRTKHQVAEVTSLGLVQMTRKKLGLGLLESFSEPCETCAGRGVIVHHDPVVKHKQTPQPEQRRRGKGGAGQQNTQQQNGGHNNGAAQQQPAAKAATHAITDDAKNMLAQIAASTIAGTHEHEGAAEASAETPVVEVRKKRRRGGKNRDSQLLLEQTESPAAELAALLQPVTETAPAAPAVSGTPAAPETASAPVAEDAPAERPERPERPARGGRGRASRRGGHETLPLLDIPLEAVRKNHKVDVKVAEDLLGSVLDALPEPKQPGKGRNRNRRVSTQALTGTPVRHDGEAQPTAE